MIYAAVIVVVASFVEYGKDGFRALGFRSQNFNALNLLVFAPLLAVAMFCLWLFVLIPWVPSFTGQPLDFSVFEQFVGDLPAVLMLGAFIWASAAFGEEIVFRGFLMRQFSKFFGDGWLTQ
jgi:membrane protease YdiL (CAAX protease family)